VLTTGGVTLGAVLFVEFKTLTVNCTDETEGSSPVAEILNLYVPIGVPFATFIAKVPLYVGSWSETLGVKVI
jgi:hypothetical protein